MSVTTPVAIESVSAQHVVSSFSVYKPEKINRLFRKYGDQGQTAFQYLLSMGFKEATKYTTYSHFEELKYHDTFKVVAAADPGAGADLTVNIHADSLDASNRSYPRIGDVVMNPATEVVGRISAKSGISITIQPNRSTENLGTTVDGQEWVITSSAFAEGTGQPEAAIPKTIELENYTQIIKETVASTGTDMTNWTWFDVREDGAALPSYWSYSMLAGEYRQALKVDGALLFNKERTNATMLQDSKVVDQTKGLIPSFREQAYVYPVANLQVSDFDAIDRNLAKNFAGQHVCCWLAIDRHQQVENNLQTYFADTNINSTRQVASEAIYGAGDDGHALAASVNFKFLLKSERGFLLQRLHSFDNPQTVNTSASVFMDMGVFFPASKTRDAKGKLSGHIGMRHKEHGDLNRVMKTWYDGAMAPGTPIGDVDEARFYQLSDIGFQGVNLNQCVLVTA